MCAVQRACPKKTKNKILNKLQRCYHSEKKPFEREKVKGITKNIYDSNRQGDRTENATLRVHFFDCDHTYIFVKEIVNNLLELS